MSHPCSHSEWVPVPGECARYRCKFCFKYGSRRKDGTIQPYADGRLHRCKEPWDRSARFDPPPISDREITSTHEPLAVDQRLAETLKIAYGKRRSFA